MAFIPRRHSLEGKCGIPFEKDRVYLKAEQGPQWRGVPDVLRFEDGRVWKTGYLVSREEFGRDFFANVCRHYQVYVGEDVKDLWEEYGRWFTKQDTCAVDDETFLDPR